MKKMYNVLIGNYTVAVVARDEVDVKRIMHMVVESLVVEEVDRHKDHKIEVLKLSSGNVITRCVDCRHYFFEVDGRKQKKDGFLRPISMAWDEEDK